MGEKIWIKTQKNSVNQELILCNDIVLFWSPTKQTFVFYNYYNKEDYIILGCYKNEEKAKKILNKIEEFICLEKGVYHMPEDYEKEEDLKND